ncbi:MAG: uroporphyrinogen-III C-methyltransferase [Anaerovoracaceae bacterium]
MENKGRVYLIGAGPGDPGLFTLKGRKCLEEADVVVYDRLSDPRILGWAKKDAERVYVGKASSHHTMKQEDISQLLVDRAKEGKTVARLKGGDPFVFGRGGEEAILLEENGIPFELVPGITSAVAVPEYAGIPVTHRKVAASFSVITGHEDPTRAESGINWEAIANGADTLVFLMGIENLEKITAQLMKYGRPADTPAAVIRWGTHPEQRTLVTTVGKACEDVKNAGLRPPAIFIVGEVVKLRETMNWFETKPLFGKTIVVTRARAQASALTERLEEEGAAVIEVPAIKICGPDDPGLVDDAIDRLKDFDWIIFTSANGVERFFEMLYGRGLDARALAGLGVGAIGPATSEELMEHGISADVVPDSYKAEDLSEALLSRMKKGSRVMIARAAEARAVLPDTLREAGMDVEIVPVYRTEADCGNMDELRDALREGRADCVTFTSSSTVRNFMKALDGDASLLSGTAAAAIGPVTAAECGKFGIKPEVTAEKYTIDGLVEAIEKYFDSGKKNENKEM